MNHRRAETQWPTVVRSTQCTTPVRDARSTGVRRSGSFSPSNGGFGTGNAEPQNVLRVRGDPSALMSMVEAPLSSKVVKQVAAAPAGWAGRRSAAG